MGCIFELRTSRYTSSQTTAWIWNSVRIIPSGVHMPTSRSNSFMNRNASFTFPERYISKEQISRAYPTSGNISVTNVHINVAAAYFIGRSLSQTLQQVHLQYSLKCTHQHSTTNVLPVLRLHEKAFDPGRTPFALCLDLLTPSSPKRTTADAPRAKSAHRAHRVIPNRASELTCLFCLASSNPYFSAYIVLNSVIAS